MIVILGNPPYGGAKQDATDWTKKDDYSQIDSLIRQDYVETARGNNFVSLYDHAYRAFHWATQRLEDRGVVAYVTNSAFLDSAASSGMRRHLMQNYSLIYILNLRGNIQAQIRGAKGEGGNIFGDNCITGIAIILAAKNGTGEPCQKIHYLQVPDDTTTEEKCHFLASLDPNTAQWERYPIDKNGDWINSTPEAYNNFYCLKTDIFLDSGGGAASSRDEWVLSYDKAQLQQKIQETQAVFNQNKQTFLELPQELKHTIEDHLEKDPTKIKWSRDLKDQLNRESPDMVFDASNLRTLGKEPFTWKWGYIEPLLCDRLGKVLQYYPQEQKPQRSLVCAQAAEGGHASLMRNRGSNNAMAGQGARIYPEYTYKTGSKSSNINPVFLKKIKNKHPDLNITNSMIMDYFYGMLHHPTYIQLYAAPLSKFPPRFPLINDPIAFKMLIDAGYALSRLHTYYDLVMPAIEPKICIQDLVPNEWVLYHLDAMKHPLDEKGQKDKSTIIYNPYITIKHIPHEAYEYTIGGKAPVDWIMTSYVKKVYKDSQILSDPNALSREYKNPRFLLDTLLRLVTVGIESHKIIQGIKEIDINDS